MIFAMMLLAAVQTAPQPPVATREKLICKRSMVTGSLVRKRRDCKTRAQWTAIAEAAREDGEAMRSFRGADRLN